MFEAVKAKVSSASEDLHPQSTRQAAAGLIYFPNTKKDTSIFRGPFFVWFWMFGGDHIWPYY